MSNRSILSIKLKITPTYGQIPDLVEKMKPQSTDFE
jgi:hypothetical protein